MPEAHRLPAGLQQEARLRHTVVAAIESLAEARTSVTEMIREEPPGTCLLVEGTPNPYLHVLLAGELTLTMRASDGKPVPVAAYRPGDLIGVSSFSTGRPSLCTARAASQLRVLRLRHSAILRLANEQPQLHDLLQRLIIENLADRYRSSVNLQLQLREANRELLETRNRLVHQEKMASLGQLTAGLAHELNNPSTVILRDIEYLAETVQSLLDRNPPAPDWRQYWEGGQNATPLAERRTRQKQLQAEHPSLESSLARRLAAMPESLQQQSVQNGSAGTALAVFESAHFVHTVQLAARHIRDLLESLRSYVRPDQPSPTRISIRENLENTLLICRHWLQPHPLQIEIASHLRVVAQPGHLSQLWTNLLKNAAEASPSGSGIEIKAHREGDQVLVELIDHGEGIPQHLRETIFQPYFTTKGAGTESGIGLGLSICRTLVEEAAGSIRCEATPGGGTTFQIRLPAVN